MRFTDTRIRAELTKSAKSGKGTWLNESLGRGSGSLALKVSKGAASWYYRYYDKDSRPGFWPIGPYGDGNGQFTLRAAREEATTLSVERRTLPDGNLHAHRERQQAQERERLRAEEIARQEHKDASEHTLRRLVEVYTDHLDKSGKNAKDASGCLNAHVKKSPLAALPARAVTRRQVTELLRGIVEAGKGRQAAKVRSYLRAAYSLAMRAEGDATAPAALLGFEIEHNPVADTASLSQFNRARDRVLTEGELREYWKRLKPMDSATAAACKVQLLTAGQRWEQLLRATVHDFDAHASTLTLRDPKGRREQPRVHVVPLPAEAVKILEARAKLARDLKSEWLFTSDGKARMVQSTPAALIEDLSAAMVADDTATAPFLPSDLRRTAETQLAAMGISRDVRGQIQSHGLGGVQARHYDRHDYMTEKRAAIDAWAHWLTTGKRGAKVVQIRKAKSK